MCNNVSHQLVLCKLLTQFITVILCILRDFGIIVMNFSTQIQILQNVNIEFNKRITLSSNFINGKYDKQFADSMDNIKCSCKKCQINITDCSSMTDRLLVKCLRYNYDIDKYLQQENVIMLYPVTVSDPRTNDASVTNDTDTALETPDTLMRTEAVFPVTDRQTSSLQTTTETQGRKSVPTTASSTLDSRETESYIQESEETSHSFDHNETVNCLTPDDAHTTMPAPSRRPVADDDALVAPSRGLLRSRRGDSFMASLQRQDAIDLGDEDVFGDQQEQYDIDSNNNNMTYNYNYPDAAD